MTNKDYFKRDLFNKILPKLTQFKNKSFCSCGNPYCMYSIQYNPYYKIKYAIKNLPNQNI